VSFSFSAQSLQKEKFEKKKVLASARSFA